VKKPLDSVEIHAISKPKGGSDTRDPAKGGATMLTLELGKSHEDRVSLILRSASGEMFIAARNPRTSQMLRVYLTDELVDEFAEEIRQYKAEKAKEERHGYDSTDA